MEWSLVTGGAQGVGAELCRMLAKEGRHVAIHYRTSVKQAQALAEECRCLGVSAEIIQGDFSSQEQVADFILRYFEQFSSTSLLINNVGNYLIKAGLQTSLQEWNDLFQTNLWTPLALIQALMPSLKKTQGAIINIGTAGLHSMRANTYCTAYTLSKMSLYQLTKSIAVEAAPHNVSVNMISPGHLERSVDSVKHPEALIQQRPGFLEEVSKVAAFLLKDSSHYITGQNIEVAGGLLL